MEVKPHWNNIGVFHIVTSSGNIMNQLVCITNHNNTFERHVPSVNFIWETPMLFQWDFHHNEISTTPHNMHPNFKVPCFNPLICGVFGAFPLWPFYTPLHALHTPPHIPPCTSLCPSVPLHASPCPSMPLSAAHCIPLGTPLHPLHIPLLLSAPLFPSTPLNAFLHPPHLCRSIPIYASLHLSVLLPTPLNVSLKFK